MKNQAPTDWQPEYDALWPKTTSELLLQAALFEGAAGADAFARWKNVSGFTAYDEIDYLSSRLMPLIYKNLKRSGIDDDWMTNLQALHRYQWASVTTKQRRLVEVVDHLETAGIPSLVLKGNALIAGGYFDDAGERPLHDLDLLIRPEDQRAVGIVLESLGWSADTGAVKPESHARGWRDENGIELDLHLKLLPPPYPYIALSDLWPHSHQAKLCGGTIRIPDATTLLMHCAAHGRMHWGGPNIPFLWVADTMHILRHSADNIDWLRLLVDSKRCATLFAVRETLGYARCHFGAPVPDVWQRLARSVPLTHADVVPFFRWTGQLYKSSLLEMIDYLHGDFVCREQMLGRQPTRLRYLAYAAGRGLRLSRYPNVAYRRVRNVVRKSVREGLRAAIARPERVPRFSSIQPRVSHPLRRAA